MLRKSWKVGEKNETVEAVLYTEAAETVGCKGKMAGDVRVRRCRVTSG